MSKPMRRNKDGSVDKRFKAQDTAAYKRKMQRLTAEFAAVAQHEVPVGGTGVTGRQYAPLMLHSMPAQSAMSTQIGGDHYKTMAIQPMEYSFKNKLDPAQHTAIKYITRFRSKGGRDDLEKAKHVIDMLIELEYGA